MPYLIVTEKEQGTDSYGKHLSGYYYNLLGSPYDDLEEAKAQAIKEAPSLFGGGASRVLITTEIFEVTPVVKSQNLAACNPVPPNDGTKEESGDSNE